MKAHYYINGTIGESDPFFEMFFMDDLIVSSKAIKKFIDENQEAEELVFHINSRGGSVDEGFAIHELLVNSGKKITTIVQGQCSSIATVIFLAGSKRSISKYSTMMIHNPWIDPYSMGGMTADDLELLANQMKDCEDRIVNFYVDKTGNEEAVIRDYMDKEKTFTASECLELKFATEIQEPIKAFAYLKQNINNKPMNKLFDLLNEIKGMIKGETKAEFKVTTNDGVELTVSDNDGDGVAAVGDTVMVGDANASEGTYTLNDGSSIVVDAAGVITEIVAATASDDEPNDLQKENDALKAEIETLKSSLAAKDTEFNEKMNNFASELVALKKNIQSTHFIDESNQSAPRSQQHQKPERNRFEEAKEKKK